MSTVITICIEPYNYNTSASCHKVVLVINLATNWGAMHWASVSTSHKREGMFIKTSIPIMKDLNSLIAFFVLGTISGTQKILWKYLLLY